MHKPCIGLRSATTIEMIHEDVLTKIEIGRLKLLQRILQGSLGVLHVRGVEFRCQEYFAAGNGRSPDPISNFFLISVRCSRVDVPVAVFQSEFDGVLDDSGL
jgi:hypothetical protein